MSESTRMRDQPALTTSPGTSWIVVAVVTFALCGAVFVLLGLALSAYNATQEFPLVLKIAFFLPPLAGAVWLAAAGSGPRRAVAGTSAA